MKSHNVVFRGYISPELDREMREFCEKEDLSISHVARKAIKFYLDNKNNPNAEDNGGIK